MPTEDLTQSQRQWLSDVVEKNAGRPAEAIGTLASGQVWASARDSSGRGTRVLIAWPSGGTMIIGVGDSGYMEHRRFLSFRTGTQTSSVTLKTETGEIEAEKVAHNEDADEVGWLAVVDDPAVNLAGVKFETPGERVRHKSLAKFNADFLNRGAGSS